MAIEKNAAGIAQGKSLAKSGKVNRGVWDESKVPRDSAHSDCFAAVDTDETPEDEKHWKLPICQGGEVYSHAIGNALSRAKTSNYPSDVISALQEISDMLKDKTQSAPARFKFTSSGPIEVPRAFCFMEGETIKLFDGPIPGFNPGPMAPPNPVSPVPASEGGDNPNKDDPVSGGGKGEEGGTPVGIMMQARSGDAIDHPYWGKIVHDLSGISNLSQGRIPLDYAHMADSDPDHVVGWAPLNGLDLSSPNLQLPGVLVPNGKSMSDSAGKIIQKMKGGVPFQASINWSGDAKMQYLDDGEEEMVNGKKFSGPGVIVRQWPLRGAAVCCYGADPNTSSAMNEFSDPAKLAAAPKTRITVFKAAEAEQFGVKINKQPSDADASRRQLAQGDSIVEVNVNIEKPADKPAAPAAPATIPVEDYIRAFGDRGARYFYEGKNFADCVVEFTAATKTETATMLAAKDAELKAAQTAADDAKKKLAAAPRGNNPASASAGGDSAAAPGKPGNFKNSAYMNIDDANRCYGNGIPFGGSHPRPSEDGRMGLGRSGEVMHAVVVPALEEMVARANGKTVAA